MESGSDDSEKETREMNFNEYQAEARKTAVYPDFGNNLWYPALGLNGESGEVAEVVKKIYRDHQTTGEAKERLVKELGDVLWYLALLADELDVPLDDVAQANIRKLADRQNRGKLHGSGDNR
jgi:NTP pyrophosphatase (non-canonical NTP hydrolase)